MSKIELKGNVLPNIPWEERPSGSYDVLWRSAKNPIITRAAITGANSIFNSAVVPYKDGFAGVFRCDNTARDMQIHAGKSKDGINWEIKPNRIQFKCEDNELGKFDYGYDPRVCWLEDRYYGTWCNGYHGPTIGVGYTHDFETFYQIENAFLPYNRNGVLFPCKSNGKFAMFSRPSDTGHTAFGDIFYSESPDMIHWGHHRHVRSPVGGWQSTKVGAGPTPIETSEEWLLFYMVYLLHAMVMCTVLAQRCWIQNNLGRLYTAPVRTCSTRENIMNAWAMIWMLLSRAQRYSIHRPVKSYCTTVERTRSPASHSESLMRYWNSSKRILFEKMEKFFLIG